MALVRWLWCLALSCLSTTAYCGSRFHYKIGIEFNYDNPQSIWPFLSPKSTVTCKINIGESDPSSGEYDTRETTAMVEQDCSK